ncbi:GAF domain-containing protein [Streptomyces spiroverticillatus]|uniref:GAF domain-containing protein n=1 Tax=Streptomyces finlayi TaxID=67296 RepID=A0A918X450_9ACTN|nr:GAF and ANTAR domain-containing protein [Streptomyces finlayi]GHA32725.1 GAF domain-containing protein [Streptomyces spiroverticillatus]GHD10374.1 GAF domain-containing protein [Streptomyces finlayi]
MNRESRWLEASVRLAELMQPHPGPEPEVTVFLREFCLRAVELLDVPAVGTMLAEEGGALRVAAASDENAELLELIASQRQNGPCVEGYRLGRPLPDVDLRAHADRWPEFCARALAYGIDRTAVLPLRHRDAWLGTWQAYGRGAVPGSEELDMAQRLADIAVLSLVQSRNLSHLARSADQLRSALTSRIAIEQAKGMLAAQWGVTPDAAFQPMRAYARSRRRKLREVARDVIEGRLQLPRG